MHKGTACVGVYVGENCEAVLPIGIFTLGVQFSNLHFHFNQDILGNRSLVADISSADKYSLTYYQNHVIEQVDKAQIIYQSAWFILGQENFNAAYNLAKTAFSQG